MKESLKIKIDEVTLLQELEVSDTGLIFETIDKQRTYLGKWLPFVATTKSIADTEKFVTSVLNASNNSFPTVFTIRRSKKFIGLIGFNNVDNDNKKMEIGYWLSKKYQKQGIMTKAVAKLCEFAFEKAEMNRIQINCAVGNVSSQKIPERLGFDFEGIQKEAELLSNGEFADLKVYSLLKRNFFKMEKKS